jgi:hypothetical protein
MFEVSSLSIHSSFKKPSQSPHRCKLGLCQGTRVLRDLLVVSADQWVAFNQPPQASQATRQFDAPLKKKCSICMAAK